jgi:ribosomal-protein-alanine N-acetyltransferase
MLAPVDPDAPTCPATSAKVVRLVELAPAVLHALAAGDLAAADAAAPVTLTPYFALPGLRSLWVRRSLQVRTDPGDAAWITRATLDVERGIVVGTAGFHGPPDAAGMIEVGYSTDPALRRQGYARAALEALLARAADEPSVRIVRASVRPDNIASRALIAQYGFTAVGEQWDDEDGLETIFEVRAG